MKMSRENTAATRRRIITVASKLFLEQGLAETSITEVMLAAGLTQGGFYRHFETKDQLIAEANRAANAQLFACYDQATDGMAPLQAIETIVRLYLNQSMQRDAVALCPLANLGSELRHANQHIRAAAMEGHQRMLASFSELLRKLGISDHHGIASTIVSAIVGAVTLSQMSVERAVAEQILDHAEATVHAMLRAADKTAAMPLPDRRRRRLPR